MEQMFVEYGPTILAMAITGVATLLFKGWQERKANYLRITADKRLAEGTVLYSQNPATGEWSERGEIIEISHGILRIAKPNGLIENTTPGIFMSQPFFVGKLADDPPHMDIHIIAPGMDADGELIGFDGLEPVTESPSKDEKPVN